MEALSFYIENNIETPIEVGQISQQLAQKGNLVYEYNPLKVFRINKELSGEEQDELLVSGTTNEYYPLHSLLDLDTRKLTFDLKHPVDMAIQPSYDGSVNIILNDNLHPPRLINSRFSVTGMGTYQIVDREGDNDTNIYNRESFDTDISLYKRATTIAKLKFLGVSGGGQLAVGNYNFYFKLADADGNETDFIAESGIVSCFIGNLNDPLSIQGGIRDQNSFKAVHFILSNLDTSYNNVIVYYSRNTSDNLANQTTEAFKILKNFPIYNRESEIRINGFEDTIAISINELNQQFNVIESAQTQEIAQNMLFMGNVQKNEIPYKELADLSLRFYPTLYSNDSVGRVNQNYQDSTGKYEYYNVNNIYYKLGYWNDEIYRFGVVYIMKDYTLSPVFNIRGTSHIGQNTSTYSFGEEKDKIYNGEHRNYIPIDKYTFSINSTDNSKGVVRISSEIAQMTGDGTHPIGIRIKTYDSENLMKELKKYTIGCIFVRQKRIATTLCQGVTIGIEKNSYLPTIPVINDKYIMESFLTKDRVLSHNFSARKREVDSGDVRAGSAMICPEYELDFAFFNQFFTGGEFTLKQSINTLSNQYCNNSNTHFYNILFNNKRDNLQSDIYSVVSLQDSQALAKNQNLLYSAMAGTAEEVNKVSYYKYKNAGKNATNILRGAYGPYLGLEKKVPTEDQTMDVLDIKIPNYNESNMKEYFQIRYQDTSPFMPISERMEWDDFDSVTDNNHITTYYTTCYRGDCFICNFTHRMVRNFADPTAPYNDEFVDINTWKDNMDLNDSDTFTKTNRGDINAVKIGHWITVKVCSNINLSLRSVDHSWAAEEGLTNKPRAFYPLYPMNPSGENKVPESNVYNNGYSNSLSSKYNFETPDVPAIKNVFNTRVIYSEVAINDAFRNGFRVFNLTHFKDYALTYGSLIKLVEIKGNLLAVFEHGICLIPVNERTIAAQGAGGNVFINTPSVLPENPIVLTDMYGSQWAESVIKTPRYVYGIDTVAKKIWRTDGSKIDLISDLKVQKFLVDNITLTEKETQPIIGIRNVKSHYNAYKGDIMFTFYDDINTIEEKVWNLCYNEMTQTFSTFYSWVPSYTANVDNIMFSFDRDTSKKIAKCSSLYPQFWLEGGDRSQILSAGQIRGNYAKVYISNQQENEQWINLGIIRTNLDGEYAISLYDDNNNNAYKYLIVKDKNSEIYYWLVNTTAYAEFNIWTVAIKAEKTKVSQEENTSTTIGSVVYGTVSCMKYGVAYPTTSFWKHGQAGLMSQEAIKPCYWYGEQHPFEFEFVVLDNPQTHKIFNNLEIISNKAQPHSFHFDIVGEVYDWSYDKLNMYCRQEATKQLFQRLGSNIKYNPNYKELTPRQERIFGSIYAKKSTYLPLYYNRTESLDTIYNAYTMMQQPLGDWNNTPPRDYAHLSGSEIIYDPQLNEFRIWTHIGCCPIDGYYDREISQNEYNYIIAHFPPQQKRVFAWQEDNGEVKYYERIFYGRIKGNSEYKEDKWYVQIPSITFMQKNEPTWVDGKPNLIIQRQDLPSDLQSTQISSDILPEGYSLNSIQVLPNTFDRGDAYPPTIGGWTSRKETKIRDKYMRVRIRYTGNDLAVISAIKTTYTESYA